MADVVVQRVVTPAGPGPERLYFRARRPPLTLNPSPPKRGRGECLAPLSPVLGGEGLGVRGLWHARR
ncbi:MAG TPA: hypothetical protein VFE78_36865, partial [Gemmataceae bacterium]|nr:hypothetical protein [Gemmataceae bacterium]